MELNCRIQSSNATHLHLTSSLISVFENFAAVSQWNYNVFLTSVGKCFVQNVGDFQCYLIWVASCRMKKHAYRLVKWLRLETLEVILSNQHAQAGPPEAHLMDVNNNSMNLIILGNWYLISEFNTS